MKLFQAYLKLVPYRFSLNKQKKTKQQKQQKTNPLNSRLPPDGAVAQNISSSRKISSHSQRIKLDILRAKDYSACFVWCVCFRQGKKKRNASSEVLFSLKVSLYCNRGRRTCFHSRGKVLIIPLTVSRGGVLVYLKCKAQWGTSRPPQRSCRR